MESVALSNLDIYECEEQLLFVLEERRNHDVGLKKLVVRSCRVQKVEYELKLREFVEEVKWDNVTAVGSDYEGTDDSPDTDELEDDLDEYELEKYYRWYTNLMYGCVYIRLFPGREQINLVETRLGGKPQRMCTKASPLGR